MQPKPKSPKLSCHDFNLPTDLLIEILKRLPLKSLIQFTCVSKSWLSLLTSPTFISSHISHNSTISKPPKHLFKQPLDLFSKTKSTKFHLVNTVTWSKRCDVKCPIARNHFVVSSYDGLLCFFDFYSPNPQTSPLLLWNPSIRKKVVVQVPLDVVLDVTPGGFPKLLFGLGFDLLSNAYKLVRVGYFTEGGEGTWFRGHVYDIGFRKWKSLGSRFVSRSLSTIRWRGVYLNGVIHWVCKLNVSANDKECIRCSILTFNLGSEEFGEIKLPMEIAVAMNETVRVVMVPRSCKQVLGIIHYASSVLSLWVMEDYGVKESWVKLFNVPKESMISNDLNVAVLSDEDLAVQVSSHKWIHYNDRTQEKGIVTPVLSAFSYADSYVESLLLLRHKKV